MDNFTLPRTDWYDTEGRIYKDALIENFNAIDDILNEIQKLSPFNIQPPNFNTISYPEVSLDSADNKVVSLQSLINIMNLKGFPLIMEFSGKVCSKISYYNDKYKLVTIEDFEITDMGEDGKIYLYLDYKNDMLYVSSDKDNTENENDILIGVCDNGDLYHINSGKYSDLNVLQLLSETPARTYTGSYSGGSWSDRAVQGKSGRDLGYISYQSRGAQLNITWRDFGAE